MTTMCHYCSRMFEVIKEREDHHNNVHKTEMFELIKEPKSKIFWDIKHV